jgi:ferric-dicitrate binding protein FerR (iron transport regulator)
MKIDELRAVLERYQQGNCTSAERKAVEEWYASLQLGEEQPLSDRELEASLAKVRDRLHIVTESPVLTGLPEVTGSAEVRVRQLGGMNGRVVTIAAAATAVAAAALVVWGIWLFRPMGGITDAKQEDGIIVVETGLGENRQLILPDGSTVQLNAGTALRYKKDFGSGSREVSLLKGEAFLQVAPHPASPFVVVTGRLKTTVLGTSFDIRSYAEEKQVSIAVITGKVKVTDGAQQSGVLLGAGQLLRQHRGTGDVETDTFDDAEDVVAWKSGGLRLKDASFDELAFEIGNKYAIRLVNRSKKQAWSYTGLFRSESLQEVIETICQTENLAYRFDKSNLEIIDK